ncbi:MAG: hypothetical protein HFH48_03810 [Lachnospiraceae bacterium]|jgi:hypothetical protein|nr:hypothetical protein [Lachnospiraceae bacterium]
MTTETMTVHKALAELKLLDSRIEKAIAEGVYSVANKHSNDKIGGVPLDDYIKIMQGGYDKATDFINRQTAIKRAVILSNAVTKVEISGVEYTRAEAIWMKNHGMEFYKTLMNAMRKHYDKAQMQINLENGKDLEQRAEQYVTAIYGQKDGKTNAADIEKVKADFLKSNQYELVDPLHVLDKIEDLEKKINDFMAEVDSALSVSNALTEITIEY